MSVTVRDIVWLAGFLEGEGFFTLVDGKGILMASDSTDLDVIEHAARIVSMPKVYGPYGNGVSKNTGIPHKLKYRVQVHGKKAASWMMTLFPLMGTRRKEQIKKALLAWRERPVFRGDRTNCPKGHPLSGGNLYVNPRGERSCRQCFSRSARLERKLVKQTGMSGNSTDGRNAAVSEQD
jgi:hypothetical protein